MRIICSAKAMPQDLFEVSPVSNKQVEDQRALLDDLGIAEVIVKFLCEVRISKDH